MSKTLRFTILCLLIVSPLLITALGLTYLLIHYLKSKFMFNINRFLENDWSVILFCFFYFCLIFTSTCAMAWGSGYDIEIAVIRFVLIGAFLLLSFFFLLKSRSLKSKSNALLIVDISCLLVALYSSVFLRLDLATAGVNSTKGSWLLAIVLTTFFSFGFIFCFKQYLRVCFEQAAAEP
jgi:uncharacterized membrane protein YkvI